ncbi:hypothetical protein A5710_02670 [Mycolicibacter sinensis]|uniref:PE-PGRS family protein n=2 Tax=Mycolicibacter TaxID=1073531 RepID=A0A1A2NJ49_MYCSD|nr:hypothetical protein A5694_10325 [Mycolicibacter sinensis]OBI28782.1 hypothetical protein A5710_02670 [Mycolicibacter sinensis]
MQAVAVAATAGGGLLTAAFLQAAVATAAPGADAFTIDGTTFDPFTTDSTGTQTEGFDLVGPLNLAPPLLGLGGGKALGILNLAPQSFDLYNGTTSLGTVDTNETVSTLLGLHNTAFTVLSSTAADGVDASQLPVEGTVYDVLNLGGGFYNVYVATPGEHGTVTDTLVTPFGNTDLSALFAGMNAANPLQPGDAFAALQAGDSSIGDDAFTIGGFTFNPFSTGTDGTVTDGFTPVDSLASIPPLLNLGGGQLTLSTSFPEAQPQAFAPQDFEVYSGTGSEATELGSVKTAVDVTNLLGMTNTQFIVQGVTAADGVDAEKLPVLGSVYDAFNLGNGWANVYTATPDVVAEDGTVTHGTVHDTLVTPFGNIDLSSLFGGFNAANPLDPGDAFTGLHVADSSLGDDAFSLGGYVFDPFTGSGDTMTEGFHVIPALLGAAPLLSLGGATVGLGDSTPINFAPQDFTIYGGTDDADLGTIRASVNVSNLVGFANTEFTVQSITAAGGVEDALLPAKGTVYDVLNFGGGWQNIYIATPGEDGTITDTLVTPFGNVDLSSLFDMFNAANPLDPGDAFTGLDEAMSTAAGSFDLFDPSSWF